MLTQIYEIATPDEARAISAIGVDHIGILVGNGEFPREQAPADAAVIAAAIAPPAKFSALFLTADISLIEAWARALRPAIIHLGASPDLLTPEATATLKRNLPGSVIMRSVPVSVMRSVPMADGGAVDIARSYDGIADYLLLDSYRPQDRQIGALGVTHDWTISRRIVEAIGIPVILAGGLGPDNVAAAIRAVRPAGVDSKTRTDRDGSHAKDIERVRRFHEAARGVDMQGEAADGQG
jgi:phosphoribosylanthranilate isomerase